jgi:hypothetical protein
MQSIRGCKGKASVLLPANRVSGIGAIDELTAGELVNTDRNLAGGHESASNFYRPVKQGATGAGRPKA